MDADVVIGGAGVVGASIAFHLLEAGVRRVVLLEREPEVGLGSAGRATGGFRAQFGSDVHVRMSLLGREELLRFRELTGGDAGFDQRGYLWLATTEGEIAQLRAAQALQHAAGLHEARMVSPAEIAALNPALRLDGVLGGAFCPSDGFVRPLGILRGYLDAALRRGAELRCGEPVVALERAGDRVRAAITPKGRYEADWFVDAAGAWAAPFAKLASVDLPVAPLRRQVCATVPTSALLASMPMSIWLGDGFHLRVRDGRVLLLMPSGPAQDPLDISVDQGWVAQVEAATRSRVPALDAVQIDRTACWAGLYEMSPDRHALVGPAPGCPNLLLANGSSGHGVMHSPALGRMIAELVTTGAVRCLDARPLRPERFAEGQPNPIDALL